MESNIQKKAKTEAVLAGIKNLPPIPKVVFEVTRLLNNSNTATNQLAELISKDHGLTSKILAVANSPLYGIKRKVSSIEFAIIVLGHEDIRSIVTALSLAGSIQSAPSKYFDPIEFWVHSMVVGTAVKGISTNLGFDFGNEAFVAGILHDIGILVIYKFFNNEFNQIVELSETENIKLMDAEERILGITHQEIGKFLGEKWDLPKNLCDTLNFHHNPLKGVDNHKFISVIHLVDYMTQKLKIGSFYWDKDFELDPGIIDLLNFPSEDALDNFIVDYEEMFQVTAESLKL
jgi:HD-like signal output (HDOD) protein